MQCDTEKEKKRQVKNLALDGRGGAGRIMKGKKGMKPESDILMYQTMLWYLQSKFFAVEMRLDGNIELEVTYIAQDQASMTLTPLPLNSAPNSATIILPFSVLG